jgi:transketolase
VALEREDGPVALLLSRQGLPVLEGTSAEGVARGGYVLWQSPAADDGGGDLDIVLIATGGEVAPTLQAGEALAAEGKLVRVVSMPCIELFEAQDGAYRDSVIPHGARARLAVEAGVPLSWWKWVGDGGDVLGIDRFGASAPGTIVLEKLGFTSESIAARARALIESAS